MWKTLVDFSAQISRFKHILPLSTAQINCSGSDLPLFRKPDVMQERSPEQWQQDAFGVVDQWLKLLGLREA
jgi:hypothetical protein